MSEKEGLSNSTRNGTGHILQDLLSSTVILQRSNFVSSTEHNFPLKIEEDNSSPEELRSCSICSESTNLRPLALQEMEILAKFILSQEQISLILQTEDHPPIFCCKICSSAILSLAKLTTQIENITISLRAVISSRNGLFNKLRREESAKISELSHEMDQISNNDDNQHVTGCPEEEEFFVKVEPIDDADHDEFTSDPLYEPDTSGSDDDNSEDVSNSRVETESELVCKMCLPNVTFSGRDHLIRHLRNKKIHPDLSDGTIADLISRLPKLRKFACKFCPMKFITNTHRIRHLRNKKLHPDISEADIAAMREKKGTKSKSRVGPGSKYVCTVCQPNVAFTLNRSLKDHMRNKNIHPDIAAEWEATEQLVPPKRYRYPCPKCDTGFTHYKSLRQHQRRVHEQVTTRRKCAHCPEVFANLKLLKVHMQNCHNVPIPYQKARHSCTMCLKTFGTSSVKNRHVELVHFPDKTTCPYGCETKFEMEADWVTHLEGCDSPKMSTEPEWTCRFCHAVFRNILIEMEHSLREHPEKSHSCSFCEKKFSRQLALIDHSCSGGI